MPGATSRSRRAQRRNARDVGQHAHGSGLPKNLVFPFLRLVAQEFRMIPCQHGHEGCRGTFRGDDHRQAWEDAFYDLWSTMEKMKDLPEELAAPLAKVVEIRREAITLEQHAPKWDAWLDRDEAASYELFLALAHVHGSCIQGLREAVAELDAMSA